ncbi:MAG: NADH-quinone oxidoreductase subunit M [Deltaproteobacteria bacterium]|nr:MAG: NADH-quinone oxidoreductase subunit M [Deltaproteobacteria bacterium]
MDHLLSIITFLPLVGALAVFASPGATARWLALGVSGLTFLLSVPLWFLYDPAGTGLEGWHTMQLVEGPYPWIADLGISYMVGIDGIALLLVLLTTLLTPIVIYSSFSSVHEKVSQYMGFMLVLETGMLGAFVALDTFLFYVFWELMLIPMYFIIGIWGGPNRIYAAVKFFIYTVVGSLLMLVAILALYFFHHAQQGFWSASILDLYHVVLPYRTEFWLFIAFALAFAIKVPMFPVHTWLPDAHVQAPTGGSVILAGVLLKLGTFGFLRYAMPLFPQATHELGPVIAGLAAIGIVYGALVAMVQDDIKKLVAYSSVSHMGVVMLGLFSFNTEGVSGSVYQMLNHGLSTGALFLLVGIIYERRHTRLIAEYGGLATAVPKFSVVMLIVTFSSIGLPGLNGFIGEALSLLGSFHAHPVATVVGTSGVIFGAVYMLWMVQRVIFGPLTNQANKELTDLTGREILYLAPILALIFVMGLAPRPFLQVMEPSVDRVLQQVNREVDLLAVTESAAHSGDAVRGAHGGER